MNVEYNDVNYHLVELEQGEWSLKANSTLMLMRKGQQSNSCNESGLQGERPCKRVNNSQCQQEAWPASLDQNDDKPTVNNSSWS